MNRLDRLFKSAKNRSSVLKVWEWLEEGLIQVIALEGSPQSLLKWREFDLMANQLLDIVVEKPYYQLSKGWLRAVAMQMVMKSGDLSLDTFHLVTDFFSRVGWDYSDSLRQSRLMLSDTRSTVNVQLCGTVYEFKLRLVPNHVAPIDSYWRSPKGHIWRVSYHPNDNLKLVYMERQDGECSIGLGVKDLEKYWNKIYDIEKVK